MPFALRRARELLQDGSVRTCKPSADAYRDVLGHISDWTLEDTFCRQYPNDPNSEGHRIPSAASLLRICDTAALPHRDFGPVSLPLLAFRR